MEAPLVSMQQETKDNNGKKEYVDNFIPLLAGDIVIGITKDGKPVAQGYQLPAGFTTDEGTIKGSKGYNDILLTLTKNSLASLSSDDKLAAMVGEHSAVSLNTKVIDWKTGGMSGTMEAPLVSMQQETKDNNGKKEYVDNFIPSLAGNIEVNVSGTYKGNPITELPEGFIAEKTTLTGVDKAGVTTLSGLWNMIKTAVAGDTTLGGHRHQATFDYSTLAELGNGDTLAAMVGEHSAISLNTMSIKGKYGNRDVPLISIAQEMKPNRESGEMEYVPNGAFMPMLAGTITSQDNINPEEFYRLTDIQVVDKNGKSHYAQFADWNQISLNSGDTMAAMVGEHSAVSLDTMTVKGRHGDKEAPLVSISQNMKWNDVDGKEEYVPGAFTPMLAGNIKLVSGEDINPEDFYKVKIINEVNPSDFDPLTLASAQKLGRGNSRESVKVGYMNQLALKSGDTLAAMVGEHSAISLDTMTVRDDKSQTGSRELPMVSISELMKTEKGKAVYTGEFIPMLAGNIIDLKGNITNEFLTEADDDQRVTGRNTFTMNEGQQRW
jgi:hypothetical protein